MLKRTLPLCAGAGEFALSRQRRQVWLLCCLLCLSPTAFAQIPYIVGTWKFNAAKSKLPGQGPQMDLRRYSLTPDGTLIGLAVIVDQAGNPRFLQFAAKNDGKDYSEFDSNTLAALQVYGTKPQGSYSETPIDSHTVTWQDKYDGKVTVKGRKWVSEDGKTMSYTVETTNEKGEPVVISTLVYDRQDTTPGR